MVEAKFTLFQVQVKGLVGYTVEFLQAAFGVTPEIFNAVDMHLADTVRPLMVDAIVLTVTHVHQAIIGGE